MELARMRYADGGGGFTAARAAAPPLPAPLPSRLAAVPRDVLENVLQCLVGWDLLALASASRIFQEELLADPALWAAHLSQPSHDSQQFTRSRMEAKREYAMHQSFRFRGQRRASTQLGGERGACIEALRFLPSSSQRNVQLFVPLAPRRLSIDVWFSLSDEDKTSDGAVYRGGILLGAQSARWQDAMVWPDYHQQFIHADADCNLYCSVVNDQRVVAMQLTPRRWYHLALVYDTDHECVYLDGKLVRQAVGQLHRDWRSLYFMQVGTGCISAGSVGAPHAKFTGWYAFNGLIDELRVWEDPLTDEDVGALAQDLTIATKPAGCLKQCEPSAHLGKVETVHSSWPRERACFVFPQK